MLTEAENARSRNSRTSSDGNSMRRSYTMNALSTTTAPTSGPHDWTSLKPFSPPSMTP
jgi:hypothetical protein